MSRARLARAAAPGRRGPRDRWAPPAGPLSCGMKAGRVPGTRACTWRGRPLEGRLRRAAARREEGGLRGLRGVGDRLLRLARGGRRARHDRQRARLPQPPL